MKDYLIIFAKEPQRGRVKTRLEGYLTKSGCVSLYKAFLRDTIELARKLRNKQKIIAFDSRHGRPGYLRKNAPGFSLLRQKGKGLGMRMHNAFKFTKQKGAQNTVIIGSDSPNLPARVIKRAFFELRRNDLVIGPSDDGGYYLIGLRESCLEIFSGIKWSSRKVFDHTLKKAKRLKKKVSLLESWYDVDTPESLERLKGDLRINRSQAKWTSRILLDK